MILRTGLPDIIYIQDQFNVYFLLVNYLNGFWKSAGMLFFLNCIYKTNYYCISLFVIIEVTSLNTSFYIGFAFVFSKIYSDYPWVLSYLQEFYVKSDILNPIFARTDYEKGLI